MVKKPYMLTEDGLERLRAELEKHRTEGRERLAERLHRALEDGQDDDFIDNAELEAARNEQSFLEGRIQELESILSDYQLISEVEVDKSRISIGAKVTIVEEGFDDDETYHLVGAAEADPVEGRISNESPLGRELLGKKKGQKVTIMAPRGEIAFKIKKIQY
ncbi:MAG: transcription elongation factor GreA [Ardenticatenaceae bacterium]|nr:transcription elongation factor GreA [Ardenticatenaceae bacterium]